MKGQLHGSEEQIALSAFSIFPALLMLKVNISSTRNIYVCVLMTYLDGYIYCIYFIIGHIFSMLLAISTCSWGHLLS